jgi:hypothetical protein
MSLAFEGPAPKTVCVPSFQRSQRRHRAARRRGGQAHRNGARISRHGMGL